MATLTITNSSGAEVYCSDLYVSIPAGKSVSTTRSASDLSRMTGLQSLIAAGSCAVAIAYSADEKASGLVDQGINAASGATGMGDADIIRFPITAGAGGAADDVTVYAVNSLPYKKMRIVDAIAYVSAGSSAGRTIQLRTAAAAGGTLCAEMGAAANGRQNQTATVTASQVITNGGSVGLFVRRSDSAIAGEVVITVRPEV